MGRGMILLIWRSYQASMLNERNFYSIRSSKSMKRDAQKFDTKKCIFLFIPWLTCGGRPSSHSVWSGSFKRELTSPKRGFGYLFFWRCFAWRQNVLKNNPDNLSKNPAQLLIEWIKTSSTAFTFVCICTKTQKYKPSSSSGGINLVFAALLIVANCGYQIQDEWALSTQNYRKSGQTRGRRGGIL